MADLVIVLQEDDLRFHEEFSFNGRTVSIRCAMRRPLIKMHTLIPYLYNENEAKVS